MKGLLITTNLLQPWAFFDDRFSEEKHTCITYKIIKLFMYFCILTNNSTPQLWNVSFHSFFYNNKSSPNCSFSIYLTWLFGSNMYLNIYFLACSSLFSQDTIETNIGIKFCQEDTSEDNLKFGHIFWMTCYLISGTYRRLSVLIQRGLTT